MSSAKPGSFIRTRFGAGSQIAFVIGPMKGDASRIKVRRYNATRCAWRLGVGAVLEEEIVERDIPIAQLPLRITFPPEHPRAGQRMRTLT